MKRELKIFGTLAGVFLGAYFLPLGSEKVRGAIIEAFRLLQWYVRNHTLPCVVPALLIAGGITTFLSQATVMRYLGRRSNKLLAYSVASVSGCILAVCSCSVLPMFAGIYQLGAGLGPATAFLYSGPAINILAIFLTARVLGFPIGLVRAVGAVAFAFVVGVLMVLIFHRSERMRYQVSVQMPEPEKPKRPLWKYALYFGCMVVFLIFSDWYNPGDVKVKMRTGEEYGAVLLQEMKDEVVLQLKDDESGHKSGEKVRLLKSDIESMEQPETIVTAILNLKWHLAGVMGLGVLVMVWRWFSLDEVREWMHNTWKFAKLLVPLLYGGVFVVGFVSTLLPEKVVAGSVGDNSLLSNLVASVIGAFWYFATLTEIPICQALGKMGMHHGPMLALLLAGPAVSLPNMLVVGKVIGWKRTLVFCIIIVLISTGAGMAYGALGPQIVW